MMQKIFIYKKNGKMRNSGNTSNRGFKIKLYAILRFVKEDTFTQEVSMANYILGITAIFQIAVFIVLFYYLALSVFGLFGRIEKNEVQSPEKKFALIIAAHNEEAVIGKIIESMNRLDYPKDLYDVFVIADNCTDDTAAVARECGANVFERVDRNKRGKGYALEWMFDKIFKMDKKYDAVGVFDADNLVSPNFLTEMNAQMLKGFKVVQGYIDSKNPHDSWISESYSVSFWASNRLFQLARTRLGLTNQIGGTGFVVDTALLKELGWGATCLTEDLEFTCRLVLSGNKVGWAHHARVYDEKPLTLKQSWNQRKRWMQGFTDVATRFFVKLMKKAIEDRSIVAFDCAMYVIQPFVTLALGLSMLLTVIQSNSGGVNIFTMEQMFSGHIYLSYVWKGFGIVQFLLTPLAMLVDNKITKRLFAMLALYSSNVFIFGLIFGKQDGLVKIFAGQGFFVLAFILVTLLISGKQSSKVFVWYLLYGVYTLTWIPITIQGILHKNEKEWSHTKHVRQIGIQEL